MAKQINATCSICGRGYHLCLSCKDNMKLHPWKVHTDTSEHYKIFQILRGFNTEVYTKEEAKSKLQKVDLSDLDSLRENIKDLIKNIMSVEEQEVQPTVVDNIQEEVIVETYKPVKSKTRNRKYFETVETDNYIVPTE